MSARRKRSVVDPAQMQSELKRIKEENKKLRQENVELAKQVREVDVLPNSRRVTRGGATRTLGSDALPAEDLVIGEGGVVPPPPLDASLAAVEFDDEQTPAQQQQREQLANAMMYQAIREGNLNRNTGGVHALVVTYPAEIQAQRAFHYAVECNQLQIVRFLMHIFGPSNELNASLRNRVNIHELGQPASKSDTNTIEETDRETPLQTAVRRGNLEVFRALMECGARDNVRTPRRRFTLLHIAVIENHPHMVRELLQSPAINVNARDTDDWAALHWAAEMGHVQCVRELCAHEKIQVNITDTSHRTPIHFAAVEGGLQQRRCIVVLWKRGADLNARARSGTTAYEIARECKQFACAELLRRLAKKTDREAVDTDQEVKSDTERDDHDDDDAGPGQSGGPGGAGGPSRHPDTDASDSEGDSASDTDMEPRSRPSGTTQNHGPKEAMEVSPDGTNDSNPTSEGTGTALVVVGTSELEHAANGSQSPKKPATPNGKTKLSESEQRRIQDDLCEQLFAAAKTNRYSEVMSLLQPSSRSSNHVFVCTALSATHGCSPMHAAAARGALNALRMMVYYAHVDLDMLDARGRSPLHHAARHGQLSTVLFLLNRRTALHTRTYKRHHTPLHAAAMCTSSAAASICKLLVRHGLKVSCADDKGYTPLCHAALKGNYDVMCALLADKAAITDEVWVAVHAGGHQNCIRLLERVAAGEGIQRKSKNKVWLQKDVSGGLEGRAPVRAINEVDDAVLPLEFGYLATCVEGPDVIVHYDACKGCNCTSAEECMDPTICPCAKLNQNPQKIIYECNYSCSCSTSCKNRVIQRGRRFELEIFRTVGKGWGVRAVQPILPDQYVCEYIGELIDEKEEKRRYPSLWMPLAEATAHHAKCSPHATGAAYMGGSYVFDISATKRIDATVFGNVGRFLNHSCDPTLAPRRFFVHHRHQIFPRIAFFSTRYIPAGTELCYDYGSPSQISVDGGIGDGMACNCGSEKCRGRFT